MAGSIRNSVKLTVGPFLSVTVNVLGAVDDDDKEVSLSNICIGNQPFSAEHPPSGVKQNLKCPVCENDDKTSFKKGRIDGGTVSIVETAAVAATTVATAGNPLLMEFSAHPADDLDGKTLNGDRVYFLACQGGHEKIYALLVALVVSRPDLVLLTTWASRSKPAMYRLVTFNGALAVQKLAWLTSIRTAPVVNETPDAKNLAQAQTLVEMAVTPFDPATYVNTRSAALQALIAQAQGVEGAAVIPTAAAAPKAVENDLTAMLEAALLAAGATVPAQPTATPAAPRKRAPRKKPVPAGV